MAINIPDSPNTGDTYTVGSRTWRFNGTTWDAVLYSAPTGPTGAAGADGATGPTGPSGSDGALSPNYIINGAFDIWQRGTSVSSGYGADRWILNLSGATGTFSRQAFSSGELEVASFGASEYYARVTTTVADDFTGLQQRIENVATLAGQTVTVSAWIRSSDATAFRLQLQQIFGSGGSATYSTLSTNITPTSSWQRYSVTYDLPSVAGKTIGSGSYLALNINVPINQTFTLDVWGVQVEAGSVATPFRRNANSLQGELAACQRYYQRIEALSGNFATLGYGFARSTTAARALIPMLVQMRSAPTLKPIVGNYLLADGVSNSNVSAISISGYSPSKHAITVEATATGLTTYRPYALIADNGTHYLEFEAEL